ERALGAGGRGLGPREPARRYGGAQREGPDPERTPARRLMADTRELTPEQVASYLEASCALIEAELLALGDDASWHFDPKEWCANQVVGHIVEAEKRGFAGRIRELLAGEPKTSEGE